MYGLLFLEEKLDPQYAYNFEVDEFNTYAVTEDLLWVHNSCGPTEGNTPSEPQHFVGTEKAWADGATPNSTYTQVHPDMPDKALQNSVYNSEGKIVGQVDFKPHHGAPSGHGHRMAEPGNIGSGHQGAETYISPDNLPSGWNKLPDGVEPIKP